jgi:hypothetical protein
MGVVEKTVKQHRSRMMEKIGVRAVADLVRLADRAGIQPWYPRMVVDQGPSRRRTGEIKNLAVELAWQSRRPTEIGTTNRRSS